MHPSGGMNSLVKDSSTIIDCTKKKTKFQVPFGFLSMFCRFFPTACKCAVFFAEKTLYSLYNLHKFRFSFMKNSIVRKPCFFQNFRCLRIIIRDMFRFMRISPHGQNFSSQFSVSFYDVRIRVAERKSIFESCHIHLPSTERSWL